MPKHSFNVDFGCLLSMCACSVTGLAVQMKLCMRDVSAVSTGKGRSAAMQ